jgi:hypothetical protein
MVRDKGLNDAEIMFFNFDVSVLVIFALSNAIRWEFLEWLSLIQSALVSLLTR